MAYMCPVCGYPDLEAIPHDEYGGASYEICPSCGFQFGYTDDDQGITYQLWRERWIASGMVWNSIGISPPPEWDPEGQLRGMSEAAREREDGMGV